MNKRWFPSALAMVAAMLMAWGGVAGAAETVLKRGEAFFQTDFEGASALNAWAGQGKLADGYRSNQSLLVEQPTGATNGGAVVTVSLPAERMRGYTVYGSALIKAEGVSAKPKPWNGVKFMLAVEGPSGKTWPAATLEAGSFDWQRAAFTGRIPGDATRVTLVLGLEAVSGKAWFDDVRIYVGKPPVVIKPRAKDAAAYKGHDLPRLRGTMISPSIDEASLRVLGQEWNANLLRWQLIRSVAPGKEAPLDQYDQWIEGELKRLDAGLAWCEQYGVRVVVDLHSPPGGRRTVSGYIGSDNGLFADKAAQDKFVQVWERIATRYKGNPVIWGFDLANEPVEGMVGDDCDDWHSLAERAAKAVNAIDSKRTIIVEPADWGGPDALQDFYPIDAENVVYSVHMYVPMALTHQTVFGPGPEVVYPGTIEGKQWDKSQLEAALKPVIDFQKTYGVHIYIGEFSAIRWAPQNSAYRYLKDLIDIFEAHGWDWSYHAFREWQGWSVEHDEQRNHIKPAAQQTDREKLLREWFAKNQKPRQ
ncbi:MAG TPA: cellulase family glycosylhydrolase [Tepidisphaeraceae bacterium]|nr:cellulase family glycosylhydrolase [Tepidisphaeraceae bacterium]